MTEAGLPGFTTAGWFGLVAPHGTPAPIIERMYREAAAALESEELRRRLLEMGAEPMPLSPGEFRSFIQAEIPRWREIVRASGAELD